VDLPPAIQRRPPPTYLKKDEANYGAQLRVRRDNKNTLGRGPRTKQAWWPVISKAAKGGPRPQFPNPIRDGCKKFEFQSRNAPSGRRFFNGTTLGADFSAPCDPVTAREFRLNILEATAGPTINEIELSLE